MRVSARVRVRNTVRVRVRVRVRRRVRVMVRLPELATGTDVKNHAHLCITSEA